MTGGLLQGILQATLQRGFFKPGGAIICFFPEVLEDLTCVALLGVLVVAPKTILSAAQCHLLVHNLDLADVLRAVSFPHTEIDHRVAPAT